MLVCQHFDACGTATHTYCVRPPPRRVALDWICETCQSSARMPRAPEAAVPPVQTIASTRGVTAASVHAAAVHGSREAVMNDEWDNGPIDMDVFAVLPEDIQKEIAATGAVPSRLLESSSAPPRVDPSGSACSRADDTEEAPDAEWFIASVLFDGEWHDTGAEAARARNGPEEYVVRWNRNGLRSRSRHTADEVRRLGAEGPRGKLPAKKRPADTADATRSGAHASQVERDERSTDVAKVNCWRSKDPVPSVPKKRRVQVDSDSDEDPLFLDDAKPDVLCQLFLTRQQVQRYRRPGVWEVLLEGCLVCDQEGLLHRIEGAAEVDNRLERGSRLRGDASTEMRAPRLGPLNRSLGILLRPAHLNPITPP